MKPILTAVLALLSLTAAAQSPRTQVMTLGVFHFNFPNLDARQISKSDQVDVLDSAHQKEIESIVTRIQRFRPTIIVIERQPSRQRRTDSTFQLYLQGRYELRRNEEEQLGFRLAKRLGLSTLSCVDEWGSFTPRLDSIVYGTDSIEAKKFESAFENDPDSAKHVNPKAIYKTKGILAELRQANDEAAIRKSLGNYLIGPFKYESTEHDFTGVDFETGRWFNRNLKIFRNIQRIKAGPEDRILVIFGAGHMNLLNFFFDCSPEYTRVKTNDYLK
ncbi:MAG: hypothetical protein JWP27_2216 [Flaviaesturariibacter sp.]|nr:hypothetical protein [Flaviaesturariibacter sp.]